MPTEQNRKLAAILFADIVGYTALMQTNEQESLNNLHKFKTELETQVPTHQGEIIQFYGDGCLAVFNSSVEAVACAKDLQAAFQSDPKVPVRIGLHAGDVVFREDNVFGDAVNIASRVESMGIPGAVLLSSNIRNQIKNKPEFELVSLGRFEFKNVVEGMTVYALGNEGLVVPYSNNLKGKLKSIDNKSKLLNRAVPIIVGLLFILVGIWFFNHQFSQNKLEIGNSIAVLPFDNFSQNKEANEYLSNGIHESVLNHLSQIGALQVKSRSSVEQYREERPTASEISKTLKVSNVLEGSVARIGDKIRISIQLIDGKTDNHYWSKNYERKVTDVFDLQNEIAQLIVQELKVKLSPTKNQQIFEKPAPDFEAYELYLKGKEYSRRFIWSRKKEELEKAKQFFTKSIQQDSGFAMAYVGIANVFEREYRETNHLNHYLDSLLPIYFEKALSFDPYLAEAYVLKGEYYYFTKNDRSKGISNLKMALDLDPNNAFVHSSLASMYRTELKPDLALYHNKKVLLLESGENLVDAYTEIASTYFDFGDFEKAKSYILKAIELGGNNKTVMRSYGILGLGNIVQGKFQEELNIAKKMFELFPENPMVIWALAHAYKDVGDFPQAKFFYEQYYTKTTDLSPGGVKYNRHRYGYVLIQLGMKEEGLEEIEAQKEDYLSYFKLSESETTAAPAYDLAGIYAYLGEREEAIKWTKEWANKYAFWGSHSYIEVDELFQPIQSDPEFQEIVKRVQERVAKQRIQIREFEAQGEL